jgi:hypothetical protein
MPQLFSNVGLCVYQVLFVVYEINLVMLNDVPLCAF